MTIHDFSFSKHLENTRVSDLTDSCALKTHLESLTEEVIGLRQYIKVQHKTLNIINKTLNRVHNFLELFCSGNGQQQAYTASTNT